MKLSPSQVHLEKMKKDTKPNWKNVVVPVKLSKEELVERAYKKKVRELKIARTRAGVLRKRITDAYEILENIRFDFLGDTMFREYIVRAKKELESAISDFLLSDTYWEKRIKEYREMTPKEYDKQIKDHDKGPTQSK